jgi:hypothetical protein
MMCSRTNTTIFAWLESIQVNSTMQPILSFAEVGVRERKRERGERGRGGERVILVSFRDDQRPCFADVTRDVTRCCNVQRGALVDWSNKTGLRLRLRLSFI